MKAPWFAPSLGSLTTELAAKKLNLVNQFYKKYGMKKNADKLAEDRGKAPKSK